MDNEAIQQPAAGQPDPRVQLAFERTFLAYERTRIAWVRTALSFDMKPVDKETIQWKVF